MAGSDALPDTAGTADSAAGRPDVHALRAAIQRWARELGFQHFGITGLELADDEQHLRDWLAHGYHGEMAYMARHGSKRSRPADLVPGTLSVISVGMDYLSPRSIPAAALLHDAGRAYVSHYALGRDYHKVLRARLRRLAARIAGAGAAQQHRVFVDSAPVLEKALARNAGLGWIGKHSNLINRDRGSWFFLGEIYTDLPLPADEPHLEEHCGSCTACISACPTAAIVAPYRVDARRCISYLTIELEGSIPEPFRRLIGNRIFGCDDCQLVCPWNRFARLSAEADFRARHGLDAASLIELMAWSESEFHDKTRGSALRRVSYEAWLRNVAVALGNAPTTPRVLSALRSRRDHPSPMVREHVDWALREHAARSADASG